MKLHLFVYPCMFQVSIWLISWVILFRYINILCLSWSMPKIMKGTVKGLEWSHIFLKVMDRHHYRSRLMLWRTSNMSWHEHSISYSWAILQRRPFVMITVIYYTMKEPHLRFMRPDKFLLSAMQDLIQHYPKTALLRYALFCVRTSPNKKPCRWWKC